jgi:peptidoglycan-associated lipoprotein
MNFDKYKGKRMQFNKIFKGLVVALPVVTLMACSSNSGPTEEELAAQNRAAQEQADADAARLAREEAEAAQASAMQPMMTMEEENRKAMAALQSAQTVYFEFDRANVGSEFYAILDKHAAFLVKNPNQSVVIEGHCDSRGTPEYNIALGERRAKSVETYLQNAGVSASQLSVVSYGEEKPAVEGSGEAVFAKNRRGVIVYQ